MIFAAAAWAVDPVVVPLHRIDPEDGGSGWGSPPSPCPPELVPGAKGCWPIVVGQGTRLVVLAKGKYWFDLDGDGVPEPLAKHGKTWAPDGPVIDGDTRWDSGGWAVFAGRGGPSFPYRQWTGAAVIDGRDVVVGLRVDGFGATAVSGVFDTNGDGVADEMDLLERRELGDPTVRLGGRDWRFSVAPDLSSLTLEPTAPSGRAERGAPAPTFRLVDVEGRVHDNTTVAGHWTLLDFWATWCGPCVAEAPAVQALAEAHGLTVLGVADDPEATLRAFLADHPASRVEGASPDHAVARAFGVTFYPTYVLLDDHAAVQAMGGLGVVQAALPR